MLVAIYLFDGVTALDAIGPYEALIRDPTTDVLFVGKDTGAVRNGAGSLGLMADRKYSDLAAAEVLIIPGGAQDGLRAAAADRELIEWVRQVDATTTWTCSVCTGAILLGAAGLLKNRRAATNWRARDFLPRFGAIYSGDRVTEDGKYLTSAGVTAGIDMALHLSERLSGRAVAEAIELSLEYDPQPPFRTGNWKVATAERIELVESYLRN